MKTALRKTGLDPKSLDAIMNEAHSGDKDQQIESWGEHSFLYTFHVNQKIKSIAEEVNRKFLWSDVLSSHTFPSIKRFQDDLVAYAADLLGGDENTKGTITCGGTESIILGMKSARDWARKHLPRIQSPEIVAPRTAHPAFSKAAELLNLKEVRVPVSENFAVDVSVLEAAMTDNTIALIGSAPQYWHGIYDPITDLGKLANSRNVWLHVDACLGGFLAPFVKELGYPVPDYDLGVKGVRSISADFHKYGYAPKGMSVVLFPTIEDASYHEFEWQVSTDIAEYKTPGISGTRSGGAIAAAWAVMNVLGKEGYKKLAEAIMRSVDKVAASVKSIEGLSLHCLPQLSILSIGAPEMDIAAVGAWLAEKGWMVNIFGGPPAVHLRLTPAHEAVIDTFIKDLRAAADAVRRGETVENIRTGVYGD